MIPSYLAFFLSILCTSATSTPSVNFVLLGATGDLAKRYIWGSLFRIQRSHDVNLNVVAAAREPVSSGFSKCKIAVDNIPCDEEMCEVDREAFRQSLSYAKLKSAEDWRELCEKLDSGSENLRVFYLAVPPKAFSFIASHIATECRPKDPTSRLQVVFEKPFGSNFQSAQTLAVQISKILSKEEVAHVDHYLGKAINRDLLEIRTQNPQMNAFLSKQNIRRVDVVIREAIDVKGRTSFYNSVGVVRDVLQNHATEMLTLLAADLPQDDKESIKPFENDWNEKKKTFMESLSLKHESKSSNVQSRSVLAGRYKEYETQVKQEGGDDNKLKPTFAAIVLKSNFERWHGVPFVLISGKATRHREAFMRVYLNTEKECPPFPLRGDLDAQEYDDPCSAQIYFHLQGVSRQTPTVKVYGRHARGFNLSLNGIPGWIAQDSEMSWKFIGNVRAYDELMSAIVRGERRFFVTTSSLLASWKLWDNIVLQADKSEDHFIYTSEDFDRIVDMKLESDGSIDLTYRRDSGGRNIKDDL